MIREPRRQLAAGAEAVAAGHAGRRLDGVAKRTQLVDVAPDRTRPHLEPIRELLAGPFAAELKQGENSEQACRGLDQGGDSFALIADSC